MLQQTRVEAVKGYYSRFLAALPTVEALAAADEALCHNVWEGWGTIAACEISKRPPKSSWSSMAACFPRTMTPSGRFPGWGTIPPAPSAHLL